METKTSAAMWGILTAAVASWDSYDKDTQRRLRNLRDDAAGALDQIRDYTTRGEQVRLRLPSVMDALLGIALANPTQTTPEILPSSTKLTRPVIDEGSASDLSWPVKTGSYDGKGRVSELGELSRTFLALTFQEVRAFLEGLAQEKSPTQAGLLQINRAAKQLVYVLSTLNLTSDQFRSIWTNLFSGSPGIVADPHLGTPTIGNIQPGNNIGSITFSPGSTKNDREMRIRITAGGGGNIPAQSDLCTITFASAWSNSNGPLVPAVVCGYPLFASQTNNQAFVVQLAESINTGETRDIPILVGGR
jgi:type II secretory pathway pseudopilin PulG